MATSRDDEGTKNIYPVTKQSRSNRIALMINNIKFHYESDRLGAERDDWVMFNLLQRLGYQVLHYNNLTGQGINEALTRFSKHDKLARTDSVFVVIMSHGDMGIISGTDSGNFDTEKIFQRLSTKNCPALMNKPKIIIIQACRGAEEGSVCLPDRPSVATDDIRSLSGRFARRAKVHIEKDFICFHSSTPHTASYRSPTNGAFFIQTLADVFNKWSHECDVEELFRKVMQRFEDSSSHCMQMPTKERNTLTKHFYLLPDRISVIIFGIGTSLKKALITNILGRDLSELSHRQFIKNTEIYENHTYEFICAPDLNTQSEYIQYFSKIPPPDMCLVVVQEGFSETDVWQQVEDLSKKTGKPAAKFTVVLPLRSKPRAHPFRCCTLQQLLSDLDKLAAERGLTLSSTRPASYPNSQNQEETRKLTDTRVNLVLLGMAGTGKSASGNTILGKRVFMSKASSNPVTTECQEAERQIKGTHVRVIDTADMFDDDIEASVRDQHVQRCRELCGSGPCVFVLVMHVSRFTDGERDMLTKLEKAFGSKVSEQTVILFTRGDDLQEADMSLEEFLHSCQPGLKEMIHKCGNRCVVFENRNSESEQVEKLMQTVLGMILEQ